MCWSQRRTPGVAKTPPTEWQVPKRTGKPYGMHKVPTCPLSNCFDWLSEEWSDSEVKQDHESVYEPPQPPRPTRSRRVQTPHTQGLRSVTCRDRWRQESESATLRWQLLLLGKIAGKAVTFLLDSGCTTNLLSRRLFDTLGPREQEGLEPYQGEHVTLANELCIPFYGIVELAGRVRDQAIRETFIVSQFKEDATLGMPFLM